MSFSRCTKVAYPSRRAAMGQLERLQAERWRPDTRLFYCWRCLGYHITSEPKVPPAEWRPS